VSPPTLKTQPHLESKYFRVEFSLLLTIGDQEKYKLLNQSLNQPRIIIVNFFQAGRKSLTQLSIPSDNNLN
jgi:hypothetical protein